MNWYRMGITLTLLFFLLFLVAVAISGSKMLVAILFLLAPLPVLLVVYGALKAKPSEYELKDGWYENF